MCYGKQFAFSLVRSSVNITRAYFPEMFSILAPVVYKLVLSPGANHGSHNAAQTF